MITLYHGTHEHSLPAIRTGMINGGLFDGIFAGTERDIALSHAPSVFEIDVPADRIASSFDLAQADHEAIRATLQRETGADDADLLDELYDAVTSDTPDADDFVGRIGTRSFADEFAATSWELQRLRGRIAADLGYLAVEMDDEHGTSYLVLGIA